MAGVLDFVFGKSALKKAAGETTTPKPKPTMPAPKANIDVAAAAQDTAKRKLSTTQKLGQTTKGVVQDQLEQTRKKKKAGESTGQRLVKQFMEGSY